MISIIAAIGNNRELGKDNTLLWHISEDLKRFKRITNGHPVIMGRKTFESIGRVLPQRINIIVTRDTNFRMSDAVVVHSLKDAISYAKRKNSKEIFIIGGGQIYTQAITLADKLYLTVVEGNFDADTYFPDYSAFSKVVATKEGHDENYHYTFLELRRF